MLVTLLLRAVSEGPPWYVKVHLFVPVAASPLIPLFRGRFANPLALTTLLAATPDEACF